LISAEAPPQTLLGTSQRSPIPLSWILGVLTEGREGEEGRTGKGKRGVKGGGAERARTKGRVREGKRDEVPQLKFLATPLSMPSANFGYGGLWLCRSLAMANRSLSNFELVPLRTSD